MSAMQRKQCPRCGRFLPPSARVHWTCVLARLAQTWFVRLPLLASGTVALAALLATVLVNVPGLLLSGAPAVPADAAGPAAPTASPRQTVTPSTAEVIVAEAALYSAPGGVGVVSAAARGQRFAILAQANAGELWYQLDTEAGPLWIAAFSVAVAQGSAPIPAVTAQPPTPLIAEAASPQAPLPGPADALAFTPTVPITPVQMACGAAAQAVVPLYSGPGAGFATAGALAAGAFVTLDGQARDSAGGVWWRVRGSGLWLDAAAMSGDPGCANLPLVPVASVELPPTADCPDAAARRLRVGGQARALTGDISLAQSAGSSQIAAPLVVGQQVTVIGGPACALLGLDSVTWWEVQAAPGVTGWVPEQAVGVYYFEPVR
ncbi:MAG: hypothetical protein ACUVSX_11540 [Aggregatilineales bacterium]